MFQDVVRTVRVRQDGGGSILNPTLLPTDNMHANATLTPLTRAQWLSNTRNSASLCAPPPSLTVSARRRFGAGSLAPSRPGSRSACTITPGLFPSLGDQRPARSPNPRPAPPTPFLCPDPDGSAGLQGHPLPRPAPPSPQPPLGPGTSQTSRPALRTRPPRRAPPPRYQEARPLHSPRSPRHR